MTIEPTRSVGVRLAHVRRLLDEQAPPPTVPDPPGTRRLTAIVPDPARAGAVQLRIDGQRFATIARVDADPFVVGMIVDAETEARIQRAADVEGALRAGLAAIGRRAFARAELARRLRQKGHAPDVVAPAIERLAALGLLDDAAFARQFAEQAARKGRGPARVARDLGARGVDRRTTQAALAAAADDETAEGPSLEALVTARLRRLGSADAPTARRRLYAFLERRGFQGPHVRALVRRLVAEREAAVE